MLGAARNDLIDGFPCKAALRALSMSGTADQKLSYLNELLADKNISARLATKDTHLLAGFKESGLAGASTFATGMIEVRLTDSFFISANMLTNALRFQSLITHELVHRHQFQQRELYGHTRVDSDVSSVKYLNDKLEIEAMGAEIAHDMRTKHLLSQSQLLDISPRLKNLTENARLLDPATIETLQASMKMYS
jgi:hypothetical protein